MSKFISISFFSTLFGSHADLLNPIGLEGFKARLISEEGLSICHQGDIERSDLDHFISTLDIPENIVFYGWVTQSSALENLLSGKGELLNYEDGSKHLEHHLAQGYKKFISPYLSEVLLRFTHEEPGTLSKAFSYVKLLDGDHSALVEEQLFKSIREQLKGIRTLGKTIKDEKELIALIQPLCSDEVILCVNYLSRSMYATRLNYVDDILRAIRTKACTARFANWILKRMELIELNKEHAYKINDLRADLKAGDLSVRNSMERGRTPIRWKSILTTIAVLLISGLVYYIIAYKPFSYVQGPEVSDNTSFKQFTTEERMKIDSLLKEMEGKREDDQDWVDNAVPVMGGSSVVSIRSEFENERMEELYEDMVKDADLQERGFSDTCVRAIAYEQPKGVKNLENKHGSVESMIRNDSEYDVILFVSENRMGGEVHSMLVKVGEIKVFKMDVGNALLLVAGNTFQKYTPPNVSQNELPSQSYTEHFCDTDMNYMESINKPYELTGSHGSKTKFLVSGDLGAYFNLVDIYNVLEPL